MPRLRPYSLRSRPAEELMSVELVTRLIADAQRACGQARRSYVVSSRIHVVIDIILRDAQSWEDEIEVYFIALFSDSMGAVVHVGDATPAELVKMAEIKSMMDDWKSGKIAVLPFSTYTPPNEDPLSETR